MKQLSAFSRQVPDLLESHFQHLRQGSGISLDVIRERGYKSVVDKAELRNLGFSKAQCCTPGILIPSWGTDGQKVGNSYRPDKPRSDSRGKLVKYENTRGSSLRLDCPPRCKARLADPAVPLWITEGIKKVDALASRGLCALGLSGVWGFKGRNRFGGIAFLADWDLVALNGRTVFVVFDSDVMAKPEGGQALRRLTQHLQRRKADVRHVLLPSPKGLKVGVDDFLKEHSVDELLALAQHVHPVADTVSERETRLNEVVRRFIQGKVEAKIAIEELREITGHRHKVRSAISYIVINSLRANGFFVHAPENRYHFYSPTKELLPLDSFPFGVLLNTLFGLNQSEPEITYVLADANTEAHIKGRITTVY